MKRHSLIYHISTFAVIISVVVACTEKAEFPLESTYVRLVVDGEINTDTTVHRVKLSCSGDALNEHPGNKISGAIVSIYDGSNNFSLHENPETPGVYETDSTVYGVPGKTYTLQISNVDIDGDGNNEEYSASSYLPLINPIDSIKVSYQQLGPQYKGWIINMYAQEIGGGRNFYLVKAWKNNVLLTDSAYECASFADNTGFEGSYYNGFSVYYLNYNKLDERLVDGDVVTLEMDGITQQYKDFLVGFISEYQPKVPIFSGPSANIPTNIEPHDKAVGFFTAYCAMRKSRVYRGE
ncbi:MAG TPA: DUF4249 family protein [Bacteroidales bacterium]|nr:DUF4249 family protein [Bacteroidales bacterium]